MIRRTMLLAIVGLVALGVGLIGNALATTPSVLPQRRPGDLWSTGPST